MCSLSASLQMQRGAYLQVCRGQLPNPSSACPLLPGSRVPAHTAVSNISNACRESHVELPVTPSHSEQPTHTHTQHGCTPSVLVSHRAFLKGLKNTVSSARGPLQRLEDTIKKDQLHVCAFIAQLAEVHIKTVC